MKRVSFQPLTQNSQKLDLALWGRWLDVESHSLRFALKGGVPHVVGKAAVLCSSNLAKIVNIRSIIRGFGYKRYPWKWWWRLFVTAMAKKGLQHGVRAKVTGANPTRGGGSTTTFTRAGVPGCLDLTPDPSQS